ncbi:unnamed protein product, partial [Phaeothamnion confervicola]
MRVKLKEGEATRLVEFQESDTVAESKRRWFGNHARCRRLIWRGRELSDDNAPMSNFKICINDFLHVVSRAPAEAQPPEEQPRPGEPAISDLPSLGSVAFSTLFGFSLVPLWWLAVKHHSYFTVSSYLMLSLLTVIYAVISVPVIK